MKRGESNIRTPQLGVIPISVSRIYWHDPEGYTPTIDGDRPNRIVRLLVILAEDQLCYSAFYDFVRQDFFLTGGGLPLSKKDVALWAYIPIVELPMRQKFIEKVQALNAMLKAVEPEVEMADRQTVQALLLEIERLTKSCSGLLKGQS